MANLGLQIQNEKKPNKLKTSAHVAVLNDFMTCEKYAKIKLFNINKKLK